MGEVIHTLEQRQRRRDWNRRHDRARRDRMRLILAVAKVVCGCEECGFDAHADAIQMDHAMPVGSRNGYRSWSASCRTWTKFWRYVFDPNIRFLCANCHAIKSAVEQRDRPAVGLNDGSGCGV